MPVSSARRHGGLWPRSTVAGQRVTESAVTSEVAMSENILNVNGTYWLLYTHPTPTSHLRIASSESPDGPWGDGAVVLSCGSLPWESTYTNGGSLMEHDGTFYLYYADENIGGGSAGAIGVATAERVTGPYVKQANPILTVSEVGWDSLRVQEPHVIRVGDLWVMAYMAEEAGYTQGTTEQCGIATASNPLGPWAKSPANPVVPFGADGAWDEGGTADPSLFYENGYYWMLYSGLSGPSGGKPWRLGLAHAPDPHGPWTRHPNNPILSGSGVGFDQNSVWRGAVHFENGVYHMPYGGIPASTAAENALGGSAHLVVT